MMYKELYMYVLGGVIAVGFFGVLIVLLTVELPLPNKDMLLIMLGILGAKFSDVVSYFYGSSKGSADKTKMLNDKSD